MGYKLRREIRDSLPPGLLTEGERHVLYEIADSADDVTREAWPGMEWLERATQQKARSIAIALQRMAAKGIELRVAIGKDKNGKPIYAARGHRTTYLIPTLGPARWPNEGCTTVQANEEKGCTTVAERMHRSSAKPEPPCTPSTHEPSKNSSSSGSSSTVRFVMTNTDADEDEAREIIEKIRTTHNPRSVGAYVRGSRADLQEILDNIRRDRPPPPVPGGVTSAQARTMSPCEHGIPGGDMLNANGGRPWCVECRYYFDLAAAKGEPWP